MSDDPTPGPADEPEHPADKILGADWMEPSYARFKKAWAEHEQHARLVELQAERDANGEPTWQTVKEDDPDDPTWVRYALKPVDPRDPRPSIRICGWPGKVEADEMKDARAIVEEHDDFPHG
jgi:hypothetical protein